MFQGIIINKENRKCEALNSKDKHFQGGSGGGE